jgi:glycosyltransferase involved in cell wall biosynthesis
MKLLIFCPYYPPHIGGLESHADEFNKYLSLRGMDIIVFTPRLPHNSPAFETRHNNVKIIRFPAFEIVPNYPLPKIWSIRFWQLFCGLFKNTFDIVISRTRFFNTSLLAFTYAKIKNVKWIHIEHGSNFVKLSSKFKTLVAKMYDYTFGFLIFRFCDQNISISRAVQKFVNKFDERESPVIYRGLDMERLAEIKPAYELKEKYGTKIIISFVGRLYKWKGVENSIRAIKNLPPEIKNKIVFIIAGSGEDLSRLQSIPAKNDPIVFWKDTPNEKAISLLKISDIYIHSAYMGGGLSTSLLEAMYCGCAIIATPNEGADEVIRHGENGILIKKPDAGLIAKEIMALLDNQEKIKEYGGNAKIHLSDNFDWEKSIKQYVDIFRK